MKNNSTVFDENTLEYDNWFERHKNLFQSELLALEQAIPIQKLGIEIGVGTGRFAQYFDIQHGVEPSENMARVAEQRGIKVIRAVAEDLPIQSAMFDFALLVTTVCFLNDIPKAFSEIHRILKPQGEIILAIVDKNSDLGKKYEAEQADNKFYKNAHFHSTEEIAELLKQADFGKIVYWQTLITNDGNKMERPKKGFGEGGFVVIKAQKNG